MAHNLVDKCCEDVGAVCQPHISGQQDRAVDKPRISGQQDRAVTNRTYNLSTCRDGEFEPFRSLLLVMGRAQVNGELVSCLVHLTIGCRTQPNFIDVYI